MLPVIGGGMEIIMAAHLQRYSVIHKKNPREIILLRGSGCKWRRCRFCNYHLDYSKNESENFALNSEVIAHVTGIYHRLEVINSGTFLDLDDKTINRILEVCLEKGIRDLHFECHWMHKDEIQTYRKFFSENGITVHIKSGVETFDVHMRETVFVKGFGNATPEEISTYFDEVCLLEGVVGQSLDSIQKDIETGLTYFNRVCVNIMVENGMPVKPDPNLIQSFYKTLYPIYSKNPRVDLLMENTDFGVG